MNSSLEYTGSIVELTQNNATVCIEQNAACISCQSKGACSSAESTSKLIEATFTNDIFEIGETVRIVGTKYFGLQAVYLAFIVPVVLMLLALITTHIFQTNDITMAITAIGILFPYYFILYLLNDRLKTQFRFYIEKID